MSSFPRGSEWRQWDLHIHTPASFHWIGPHFQNGGQGAQDEAIIDQMITALNNAHPAVFAIMDYWTFDGWLTLKNRLAQPAAPKLKKMVFPGIELRLSAPLPARLNAHVIFSDAISDQQLVNFLSSLKLSLIDEPLSKAGLIAYARQLGTDMLQKHGFTKEHISKNDDLALQAGCITAEISPESYKAAIENAPNEMAIGFMPFSTNDGLGKVNPIDYYAYAASLFRSSPIFETRDDGYWNAFVGRKIAENEKYFDSFREALQGKPRLPVAGSDAHCFTGNGTSEKRGYGDFPSGKITWIKADPTWRGLLQAIKEPHKRCFIGNIPPKLSNIQNKKFFYISSIALNKAPESNLQDSWFDGCHIELNTDLVAIIGNKGSGKSALADAIALLGNSREGAHFSFLKHGRFRGKTGDPARQFVGQLTWMAGESASANLADDPSKEKIEMVKYIPQGRFEALCNDHVTGLSNAFEKELRNVIFSHIPTELQFGTLDFDQLIEFKEKNFRAERSELRKELSSINEQIVSIEDQLHPKVMSNLQEQLNFKQLQLQEIQQSKPAEIEKPSDKLTPKQQIASDSLEVLENKEAARLKELKELRTQHTDLTAKQQTIKTINEKIDLFETQFTKFSTELMTEANKIGLESTDLIELTIKRDQLTATQISTATALSQMDQAISENNAGGESIKNEKKQATIELNEPQRRYQTYLEGLRQWNEKIDSIVGNESIPDSKTGIATRISQLESLPTRLITLKSERDTLVKSIYKNFDNQRKDRAALFTTVQDLLNNNDLINNNYNLQFQSNLTAHHDTISATIFSIIKQNIGTFRGEDESRAAIKLLFEQHGIQTAEATISFVNALFEKIEEAATSSDKGAKGIRTMLRKDRNPKEFYDYIFGLEFIDSQYDLLFQGTPIEQLSPGQRGALLLIFYLLVDNSKNPIILDQPEENLDNETIVGLLVPVIEEAKKNRQIIMVTHNPNLAVVCDSEQIISAKFDRNNESKISYYSGSIEEYESNKNVVNILEGTKRAFDNRSGKYFHD